MPSIRQSTVATERDEDGELLAAVAERRDRAAFAQLVERHQQALFALAQYLALDRARAEEAVQDALLQVWNRADRFAYLGPGSVRAWLLRITANEGIRAARSRDREARRIKRAETERMRPETDALEGSAEHRELLAALRAKLEELSGAERELVALYYGAGLDQQSIADHLQLSQQAVSHRLKRILETLREGLLKGGFAAALPLLDSPDLCGALHAFAEVPPGFADQMAYSLSRESVRSVRVAKAGGVIYALGAVLFLVAAGGAVWWFGQGTVAVREKREPADVVPEAVATPAPQKLLEEVVYTDEFDTPGLNDFWLPAQPPNTKERITAILKQSRLLLLSGGQRVSVNASLEGVERKYRLNPRVELVSRFVDLDERPVEVLIGSTEIVNADSCYTFEGAVVDDRDRLIFRWKQSRTAHGGPLQVTNLLGGEEFNLPDGPYALSTRAYLVVDREGHVKISEVNRQVLARGKLNGGIERLRLRFKLESFRDTEHIGFTLESLSIKRLAVNQAETPPAESQQP